MTNLLNSKKCFIVELVKPSHYDDEGYVIQWFSTWPSSTLATLNGLILDASDRQILGEDVKLEVGIRHDDLEGVPIDKMIKGIRNASRGGVVFIAGVQTCQIPRALDLSRAFIQAGIQVVMGGPHITATIKVFGKPQCELIKAMEMGLSIFAGEAEGRMDELLKDAYEKRLRTLYPSGTHLPSLQGQPIPVYPCTALKWSKENVFDVGRGCPFNCDFCSIFNIFGHESRSRSADDVEKIVRWNVANGMTSYFITDDNFSRNKNWEAIFDRLIKLKKIDGISTKFQIQIDTGASKIPRFVEKAVQAGCWRVFIGIESISEENLEFFNKLHNKVNEYRDSIQKWRDHDVLVIGSYIIGTPVDTEESIKRDIKRVIEELPADYFTFQILVPLPGSTFHKNEVEKGAWIHHDLNLYDSAHLTFRHPQISHEKMAQLYREVWDIVYAPSNVKRILQRCVNEKRNPNHAMFFIIVCYGIIKFENVHPYAGGLFRKKNRKTRRHGLPLEPPHIFYPHRIAEIIKTFFCWGFYALRIVSVRYFCLKKQEV